MFVSKKHYLRQMKMYEKMLNDQQTELISVLKELYSLALAQREWIDAVWIDAIPDATHSPTMPGHSRDWADETLNQADELLHKLLQIDDEEPKQQTTIEHR